MPVWTISTELLGGMTMGVGKFEDADTATDKYVAVLFRKTQYAPASVGVEVGNPMPVKPEFVM